ncbi:FtsX-like permease family protein [Nodosilinea sp. LEGE 06152]|uniref:ABC transporter permease DevC n=1 Tax=Nodosilinea sp. LEGE 06152 TaxID=2777966 RepID=UPI0018820097|nr:ABC transporter permease DevC [Nodosilinea sp. LEGE 06152]MBE9157364.1 FtsX-like permease family protein [Nodosilinea sp. LEGE 06152]
MVFGKLPLPRQEKPLAWSQLSHQRVRLLVALSGISFANILIFMQLGFRSAMFSGTTNVPASLDGDVFLINETSQFLGNETFDKPQIYRAAAVPGVATARPFYYNTASWVNPDNRKTTSVTVIAMNPAQPVMAVPAINDQLALVEQSDRMLFDTKSLPSLGPIAQTFTAGQDTPIEVQGRKMRVNGTFALGSNIFKRGHIVISDVNYLRLFGAEQANQLHAGVIKLAPGADLQTVIAELERTLPEEISALSHAELIELEERYWAKEPAGIIFDFGTIMGFVVGVVIVYQVLYSDVNDHLSEYATLKAIGYSDGQLLLVVFQEATILAVLGFMPGILCSLGLYSLLSNLTGVAVLMRLGVGLQVFSMTLVMGVLSAAIAVRKLRSADPADVF